MTFLWYRIGVLFRFTRLLLFSSSAGAKIIITASPKGTTISWSDGTSDSCVLVLEDFVVGVVVVLEERGKLAMDSNITPNTKHVNNNCPIFIL
jgi:hypothetical protein